MNQSQQVLAYIKMHGAIDPLTAMQALGIMRLSARIWDLRAQGFEIEAVQKKRWTPTGVKTWAEYRLIKEPTDARNI